MIGLNGEGHLSELRALVNAELSATGLASGHVVVDRIRLDDAEWMLRRVFGSVTRHDLAGRLRLPDPRPVADYVLSLGLSQRASDQKQLAAAVTGRLDFRAGEVFTVTTQCGWLICT